MSREVSPSSPLSICRGRASVCPDGKFHNSYSDDLSCFLFGLGYIYSCSGSVGDKTQWPKSDPDQMMIS